MKANFILGMAALAGLVLIGSCSKDDPPPKAGITFEIAEMEINESDGTISSFHPFLGLFLPGSPTTTGREISIKVVSDKPVADNTVIGITFEGTATRNSSSNPIGDYEVVGSAENIVFEKGATSATIKLKVFEDFDFEIQSITERHETVIITLKNVISGPAVIGDQNKFTLKIFEDDALVILDWTDKNLNVDMDLFLWLGNDLWDYSINDGTDFELVAIQAGLPNAIYGMSYTYYSGSSDNLEFFVDIYNFGGSLNGANGPGPLSFDGVYTKANINVWDDEESDDYRGTPPIVQTMNKNALNYSGITNITIPEEGSRIRSAPELLNKERGTFKENSISKEKLDFLLQQLRK